MQEGITALQILSHAVGVSVGFVFVVIFLTWFICREINFAGDFFDKKRLWREKEPDYYDRSDIRAVKQHEVAPNTFAYCEKWHFVAFYESGQQVDLYDIPGDDCSGKTLKTLEQLYGELVSVIEVLDR